MKKTVVSICQFCKRGHLIMDGKNYAWVDGKCNCSSRRDTSNAVRWYEL